MKASLQPKPVYCSRDYYYSSRFNQQYEKPTPILNYVQHSKFNCMNHSLNVKVVTRCKVRLGMEREYKELDFGPIPQKLQEEYLDIYNGIQSDIVSLSRFDENSDISMTYLGKIGNIEGQDKLKAEESFPISENGYTLGRLLDETKCQLLLDTGASKSFMSNHCTTYQNLLLPHKKYRLKMVSVLVYYS